MFVRWDELSVDQDEQAALPGYRDAAAVRRFDAPEALDTRFYEVRARSVLNRVPERSPMPFRWTINPYRGCAHACSYCMSGETLVMLADGRNRRLEELRVGDRILGTEQHDRGRRLVETGVLAKWSSIKPAWEVSLADGTRLVASAEHRFLTTDGWLHLADSSREEMPRAHLTEGSVLLGPGGSVEGPVRDRDYMRGYVTGVYRADGHVAARGRGGGHDAGTAQFRLALADPAALGRAQLYLADLQVAAGGRLAVAGGSHARVSSARSGDVDEVRALIEWPLMPTPSWSKGFLAGAFDVRGREGQTPAISSGDPEVLERVELSFQRLGFPCEIDPRAASGALRTVRLSGELGERMRFLLSVDPAVVARRELAGSGVNAPEGLRVESIRPLGGTMRMYDITTGTEDFIADGVVSHNCFARPTHTYLGFDAGRDFEREIVVKVNAPEVLRAELARRSWQREHVALGTNTDPYQWVEGRYRLMEGIWEALRDAVNPCSILTKSPLLLRDLKVMLEIAQRTEFTACLSIPTLDEKAWRETEPRTPNPRARLEAVAELNRAGIPTGVLIAPLMPGINDAPAQVEPLLEAAREAGATNIAGTTLHLRGEVRDVFMDWLAGARPELVPRYRELYKRGPNAPQPERERLARMVRRGGRPGAFWRDRSRERAGASSEVAIELGAAPGRNVQGSLF